MTKHAFTLMETLVVLAVLAMLLMFTRPFQWEKMKVSVLTRSFFDQVVMDLNFAKELSMVRNQNIYVAFDADDQVIVFRENLIGQAYQVLDVPAFLQLKGNYQFIYHGDGSISSFRTVIFMDWVIDRPYYLVFQLGSGKFEVRQ